MNEKKSRPKSQIMAPNASPVSQSRKNGCDSLPSHRYENEWEMKERELMETKARAAQMEKTMRWWSDCTANWRSKWSQVRAERNQARDELRASKFHVEELVKELEKLRSCQSSSFDNSFPRHSGGFLVDEMPDSSSTQKLCHTRKAQTQTDEIALIDDTIASLEEKVSHMSLRFDEANRTIAIEREEKIHLNRSIERLQRDLSDLQELYDNLKKELIEYQGKDCESGSESFGPTTEDEAKTVEVETDPGGTDVSVSVFVNLSNNTVQEVDSLKESHPKVNDVNEEEVNKTDFIDLKIQEEELSDNDPDASSLYIHEIEFDKTTDDELPSTNL